jgi:serine/threonine protein kinase
VRAGKVEGAWRRAFREDALPRTQEHRIDQQHEFFREANHQPPTNWPVVSCPGFRSHVVSAAMIGRTLLHYKVVAELGAGGMGVVYEGLDLRLDRRVALKILPADKTDDHQRRARFLHEARTASALNDPHIVTIYDICTVDDTDVLVMELVQGRTLRQILDEGPMPIATALDIAIQVAEGVGAAHAAGIVHRDLKPGNVMINERGRVKVLDFGLAKLVGGALAEQQTMIAPATVAGMLLGTVDYMSPEQARGDAIDARSDIFSLGAMLYEMIAGARPFTSGHALGVLHEIVYGSIVPLRAKRPEVTADVERIVAHALERDLAARFQTMEAFGEELRRAHRAVVAEAPTVAGVPAPVFTPPPLPASSAPPPLPHAAPPSSSPLSAASSAAAPSGAHSVESLPVCPPVVPTAARRAGRGWRVGRLPRRKRSRWVTAGLIFGVIYLLNAFFSHPTRRATTPRDQGEQSSDVDKSIEDTIAYGLQRIGSGSAEMQFASAKIYWERAQRTKDPDEITNAERAFTEALRIGLDDKDNEQEAQAALREIAALKAASGKTDDTPSAAPATEGH